jgi:hypothetical protein
MANTKIPAELVSDEVFGRRNLIINGDMRVAQRATSATVGPNGTGEGYQTLDRWRHGLNNTAVTTVSQSTTVPTGEGFANSMKIDVTTADTSVASNDFWFFTTKLEGQDLQRIKKGTSNAEKLTLSFWVRSTKTGVYVVELVDNDNSSRAVSLSYTIASADTWQKVELVFPADTTGAFDNDNNASLEISWWLIAGSNYSSGTLATTWGSQTDANRAVGQVNLFDSTSNEYYITGVQLEVGDNATPFEHLSFDEQSSLCKRYYQLCRAGYAEGYSSTAGSIQLSFGTPMRATPSATLVNGTNALLNIGIAYVNITALGGMELGNTHGATNVASFTSSAGLNYIMTGGVVGVSAEL